MSILNNFVVRNRINLTFESSGLDTLGQCLDRKYFLNYPYAVNYRFNSRGFRDDEWPDDLINHVWALGDSFTVGVGAPVEHNWCNVLSKNLNYRVLNCSMEGASNDWIAQRTVELLKELPLSNIIIQWTYLHRREVNGNQVHFDKSSLHIDDVDNLVNNIQLVESVKNKTNVIHSTIPYRNIGNPNIIYQLLVKRIGFPVIFIPPVTQIDFARDYHHYDLLTSAEYAKQYELCLT